MSREASRGSLRLALTPRWLAFAGVTLVFVIAAVLLGRWQWDRTQTILEAERASASVAIPIGEALPPGLATLPDEVIGRPVTLAGAYDPGKQVTVSSREFAGRPGVWVATALRLDDGRLAAVLRGWLPSADAPGAAPPTQAVDVTGVIQPDETFYADATTAPGTVVAIDHNRLSAIWGEPVLPGYVVLTEQDPQITPAPVPVPATVQTGNVPFPLQNFVYAFQWWLFALFAIVVFVRWLRMDSQDSQDAEDSQDAQDAPG